MRESKANDRLLRNLNGLLALIHFKLHLQTYILIRAPMSHQKKKFQIFRNPKNFSFSLFIIFVFVTL